MAQQMTLSRWATKRYGADWRTHGVALMEAWAAWVFGPNWRGRLGPRQSPSGYAANPRVTLTVSDVMDDCRTWFLAHAPGEGWNGRVIVNSGLGRDVMAEARRRITGGYWELCAACNLPVWLKERILVDGQSRHTFCRSEEPFQPYRVRDVAAPSVAA